MRRLTILSVAYALAPVGPDAVGGAEQVLGTIDGALVAAGHRSLVVACAGSRTAGRLFDYPAAAGAIGPAARERALHGTRAAIARALASEAVDVVHMHGLDMLRTMPPPGVPVLGTLHLPADWYPGEALVPLRPDTWVHGVSWHQHASIPPSPARLPPIGNGVPVQRLGGLRSRRCAAAAMLARICPEKGVHLALLAAHAADVPLLIAGEAFAYPEHRAYLRDQVMPLLDRRRRWLGPAGLARKRRLLSAARCLLVPSLAPETSSLVAMEAASCGAPVIAFRSGALPEVVEHGRTGLLVDGVDGMAAAPARHRPHRSRRLPRRRPGAVRRGTHGRRLYRPIPRAAVPGGRGGVTIAVIDDPAALAALAEPWAALWRRSAAHAFQSPQWLLPWWRCFGTGEPRVATLMRDGELAGILPCTVLREAEGAKLLPMGAGTTDYLDALGEGGPEMLHALLDRAGRDGVDRCDLFDLPPGSALRDAAAPPGWIAERGPGAACPVLMLPGIARAGRRALRLNRNRAARAGGWAVEQATAETLGPMLETLVALHSGRWAEGGEAGVLHDPAVLRFHRMAAPGLLDAGLLRLSMLRVGGVPSAVAMALLSPGRLAIYLSGYDVAQAYCSPGSVLIGAMLEQAEAEGRTEADFLRGREGYKYAWGAVDRVSASVRLIRVG